MNESHLFFGPLIGFTTAALIIAVAWNFARGGNHTVTALIIAGVVLSGSGALIPMPEAFSMTLDVVGTLSALVGLFLASLDYRKIRKNRE